MTTTASIPRLLAMLDHAAAGSMPHGPDRSLNDHLRGTMKILLHWNQPQEIVAAGLLHSIYSTDAYKSVLVPLSRREEISALAGEHAERLAYLFCAIKRDKLFQTLSHLDSRDAETIAIECHQGPPIQQISREDLAALLIIYMANAAEQSHTADHAPGQWLAAASRWGNAARPLIRAVPPVFDSCATELSLEDEQAGLWHYLQGEAAFDHDVQAACFQLEKAASLQPWVAEPHIFLACSTLLNQQWAAAFDHAASALRLLDQWGTAWDKRLPFSDWKGAAGYLKDCAEWGFTDPAPAAALVADIRQNLSQSWVETFTSFSAGLRGSRLPPRMEVYLEAFSNAKHPEQPAKHAYYPGLESRAVYDAADFPLAVALEAACEDIRSEFQSLASGAGFQRETERISRTGSWNVFMLYELGKRNEENCARCPITAAVVEKHAAVYSCSSAVYFSVMAPHSRIAAHTGPTNMRVRCHLGIDVPPDCGMRVGDEILTWQQGRALVFSDALSHEVWNDSGHQRVVLVADLWHPDLSAEEQAMLEGLQRYASAHARDMSSYWAQNDHARSEHTQRPAPDGVPTS